MSELAKIATGMSRAFLVFFVIAVLYFSIPLSIAMIGDAGILSDDVAQNALKIVHWPLQAIGVIPPPP